jgi:hypothetical protein
VRRRDALAWRREKTAALIDLAKATPAKDTPDVDEVARDARVGALVRRA